MTNKEAIDRITQNIGAALFHAALSHDEEVLQDTKLDVEAFKMGIKALEVDLVLCKECKYFSVIEDYFMCGVWSNVTNEEEFCSYGERSRR